MSLTLASVLRKVVSNQDDISYRSDYSGRGMYGKRCIGLDGDRNAINALLAEVGKALLEHVFDARDDEDKVYDAHIEAQDVMDALFSYRQDSMGLGIIVYWPDNKDIDENGNVYVDEGDQLDDEEDAA